jgi:hypothetical protein
MAVIQSIEIDRYPLIPTTEPGPGDAGEIERSVTDMFCMIATPKDAAGLRIRGYRRNNLPDKNHTFMKIWQAGDDEHRLWEHEILAVNERKIDSAAIVIEGRDAFIYTLAHGYLPGDVDPETGFRWSCMGLAIIEGVWTPIAPGPSLQHPGACVPPGNRPYFLPNNPVTRGQDCKIIALALKLPLPTDGRQTFEDIPPGSPFYPYIEAVHEAEAINGYPCVPQP